MYLYLSSVERKEAEFYLNMDKRRYLVWLKWFIFISIRRELLVSLPITSNKVRALQIVESWNPRLENMEKMENTKQMSENTIYDSKHFINDSKRSICRPDDSKHIFLQHLSRRLKNHIIRACRTWSWVGELKIIEQNVEPWSKYG